MLQSVQLAGIRPANGSRLQSYAEREPQRSNWKTWNKSDNKSEIEIKFSWICVFVCALFSDRNKIINSHVCCEFIHAKSKATQERDPRQAEQIRNCEQNLHVST